MIGRRRGALRGNRSKGVGSSSVEPPADRCVDALLRAGALASGIRGSSRQRRHARCRPSSGRHRPNLVPASTPGRRRRGQRSATRLPFARSAGTPDPGRPAPPLARRHPAPDRGTATSAGRLAGRTAGSSGRCQPRRRWPATTGRRGPKYRRIDRPLGVACRPTRRRNQRGRAGILNTDRSFRWLERLGRAVQAPAGARTPPGPPSSDSAVVLYRLTDGLI